MRILAIETSCDETAISIVDTHGNLRKPSFEVLGNVTLSQAKIHAHYGGVFPMLAKREHSRSLVPILKEALAQGFGISNFKFQISKQFSKSQISKVKKILEREPELLEQFLTFIPTIEKPPIDAIAVTYGPGLEPALWVGINFAKALALVWDLPIIPVNHMKGHAVAALLVRRSKVKGKKLKKENQSINKEAYTFSKIKFPVIALLISGGHTELILMKSLFSYKIIGQTRDDAAGEAFDKVARLLGLPYPGGPEISKLAATVSQTAESPYKLPRPMLHSPDSDFSFSGLKTAVLYMVKKIPELTLKIKAHIAREFEEAIADVVVWKTLNAAKTCKAKTIIMGGGVAANARIRRNLAEAVKREKLNVTLRMPDAKYSTDNALMIALAAYIRTQAKKGPLGVSPSRIRAVGNLRLT